MRRVAAAILLALSAPAVSAAAWQEIKGDHFIVYHMDDEAFAKEVSRRSETYYNRIASDLGYARHSNFWQWENRVKIYIYPSREAYLKASGQPAWSHGMADYGAKSILSYSGSESFLESLLPHELTHLIFRDFVGFKGEVPLWIDEGVAQWEEPEKRAASRRVAAYLVESGQSYPLKKLTSIYRLDGVDEKSVLHFYMQSVTLIDFLIRRHGAGTFTDFCRQLRDGKSLDDALRASYPPSLSSLELLEAAWKKDVLQD